MLLLKKQRNFYRNNQHGNVFWFILLAIFLLGALTVMLTRTSGQTEETGESDKATIRATELIRHAATVETAIQNLLLRGTCSENTISLWRDDNNDGVEDSADSQYNPNAPTDHSCHVFDVRGGGVKSAYANTDSYNIAEFVGIGVTTARDLYIVMQNDYVGAPRGISKEVCMAINRIAGNNFNINSLPVGNMITNSFTGSFTGLALILGDNGAELPMAGVKMGCNIDNDCGGVACNSFYSVILAR